MVQALNCKGVDGYLLVPPYSSDGKAPTHSVGDLGSIPGS